MSTTSTGLLRAARDPSDNAVWQRFLDLYEPLLHGWLRRQGVQHADAEELVQDVLAAVALALPTFQHNGRTGAFRCWLRQMLVNRLRVFRRSQQVRSVCRADSEQLHRLAEVLADADSDLSQRWGDDHDRFVAGKLLARIEPEFQPKTWRAFQRVALDGADPDLVAAELDLSVASVYAAKSRVLKRLHEEAAGLLD